MTEEEKLAKLNAFAKKLHNEQISLDPNIAQLINDNMEELYEAVTQEKPTGVTRNLDTPENKEYRGSSTKRQKWK